MRTYRTTFASLLLTSAIWPAAAFAQCVNPVTIECEDGVPLSGCYADVIANDPAPSMCTLDGATVTGSVLVSNGMALTTMGTVTRTTIFGSVQGNFGGDITLENTDIFGPVTLAHSGNLTVNGDSTVDGSIVQSIAIKDSGDVIIGASASTAELLVENTRQDVAVTVDVSGSVAAIQLTGAGDINLTGATVFPGGVSIFNGGDVTMCDARIGIDDSGTDGSGGVTSLESGAVLAIEDLSAVPPCLPSTIEGAVIVEQGEGDVRLVGTTLLAGDLIVINQTGHVEVTASSLSDVKIEKIRSGSVTLTAATLDSDTTIVDICSDADCTIPGSTRGDVLIASSGIDTSLGGDVEIKSAGNVTVTSVTSNSDTSIVDNDDVTVASSVLSGDMNVAFNRGMVTVRDSSFSLEDIRIATNDGPVLLYQNCDMRLTVVENQMGVMITNNKENPDPTRIDETCDTSVSGFGFSDADVSKNGDVVISNNTGEGLFCSDNNSVTGSDNMIAFIDGQCAGDPPGLNNQSP